jgi:hypothetical protein
MEDKRVIEEAVAPPLEGLELIAGAVDLHVHSYPELGLDVKAATDDVNAVRIAASYGLAGLVFKSISFPTTATAYYIGRQVPGINVYGSITLNAPVGGLAPLSVEIAARQGAKVVWFPHWSAVNDQEHGGFTAHTMFPMFPRSKAIPPIRILDAAGKLDPVVFDILDVAKQYDLIVASGHVSPTETLALFKAAKERGVRKLVFTHPLHGQINADVEAQKEAVRYGAVIEHVFLGCMPMHWRIKPDELIAAISAVGIENIIITSDAWRDYNPPGAELLRLAALTLRAKQMSAKDIRKMICDTPRRLVGLPEK